MRLRHVVLLVVAAGWSAAGGSAAGAAAAQVGSGPDTTSATGTVCVALVVDGRALGSPVSTDCATVPKGATGIDVLQAAGHTVGFRSDGLLCTIDGLPKGGCASVDDSHFWAYFHRAPGATSWTYSTEGPSTYRPVNASTEGWVYRDATTAAPADVAQSKICKTASTAGHPSPTPSRHPTHRPTPRPTADRHHPAVVLTRASPPARHGPLHRHHPGSRHRERSHPGPTRLHGKPPTFTPTPSASAAALTGAHHPGSGGGSSGSTGLIIGAGAVVVLGSAAVYRYRRASSERT